MASSVTLVDRVDQLPDRQQLEIHENLCTAGGFLVAMSMGRFGFQTIWESAVHLRKRDECIGLHTRSMRGWPNIACPLRW